MITVHTEIADLFFDEIESTLHVKIKDGVQMTAEAMTDYMKVTEELTKGEDYFALVDASKIFTMDAEIWNVPFSSDKLKNRIAVAYIASFLPNRLTINHFKANYHSKNQSQLFRTEEEARTWLKLRREQHLVEKQD